MTAISLSSRFAAALQAAVEQLPCDAAALLKLEGDALLPLAVHGLAEEALQRRFPLAGHPRLATLVGSRGLHRFPSDCGLPDPYDGLVEHPDTPTDQLLPVHDCMGAPLMIAGRRWGVVTLDALRPGAFDAVQEKAVTTVIATLQTHLETILADEARQRPGDARSTGQRQRPSPGRRTIPARDESSELAPTWGAPPPSSPRSASADTHALEGTAPPLSRSAAAVSTIVRETRQLEGRSPAWQQLIREVDTVAPSDLTVLILGETGVGKELVAQRLHEGSRRSMRPLVQVNCAALPETLADSELFGHRRGAFTGATQDRMGKFELAAGGTLMLDEVGELPLTVQAKLLRVLQSGDIQRPGSDRPLRVDVRVVAATNRDLRAEVAAGRFRADLYHRLAVYPVHVPPLRARGRDVLALAGVFLEENQHRLGARNLRLSPAARDALLRHDWPGNVRELEHLISRAALRAWAGPRKAQRWTTIEPVHLGLEPVADARPSVSDSLHFKDPGDKQHADGSSAEAETSADGVALPAGHASHASHASHAVQQSLDGEDARSHNEPPSPQSAPADTREPSPQTLRAATEAFQRQWLADLLRRHPGSMAAAAREAGMDRSNFHRLIRKWGLTGPRR